MVKIAVTGKGGVGKTTLAALLCFSFRNAGYRVLAVDADPDANLASTLGFPDTEELLPIAEMKELIAERTGTAPESKGLIFKLNPRVDDIPEKFGIVHDGIKLLMMGRVKKAGTGCYCPENAFVRELMGHLLLEEKDVVVLDMEAGIEHMGRGTAGDVDAFIVVVEPGKNSLDTARRIIDMASGLGVKRHFIIVNKVRNEEDREFVEKSVSADEIIGVIPYSEDIADSGKTDLGIRIENISSIDKIRDKLLKGMVHG